LLYRDTNKSRNFEEMGAGLGQEDPPQDVLEEITEEDEAWASVSKLVEERSSKYTTHYGYSIRVKRLWRVRPTDVLLGHETSVSEEKLGPPERLFHGTSAANTRNIIQEGFKLPTRAGMFGKGIYFAKCPLKSANYSREEFSLSGVVAGIGRFMNQGLKQALQQQEGHMLLCDVHLGRVRTVKRANNKLDPAKDLKSDWLTGLLGYGDYNSVHAPGGFFLWNAVRVSEYIVYKPSQGIPRYLIQYEFVH